MGVEKRRRRRKKKRKVSKGSKVQGHAAHPNTRKQTAHKNILLSPSALGFSPFLFIARNELRNHTKCAAISPAST
jgi:hypothetical protein